MQEDGITYRQAYVYASQEELNELIHSISNLLMNALEKEPSKERKLRAITTIVLPKDENVK